MPNPTEVHICDPTVGHRTSTDCFCEPVVNYWITDKDGKPIHVFEHNDDVTQSTWVLSVLDHVGKEE